MSNVTTTSSGISAPKPMTPFQEFWHYFKRNKGAVVGLVYIVIVLILAIGANVLAPHPTNCKTTLQISKECRDG